MAATAMAEELERVRESLRVLEAKVVESEQEADSAEIVVNELISGIVETESWLQVVSEKQHYMENSLQEFEKIQDWKADQTEELWKETLAVRQRLEYLLKKDSKFEARISQLEEEVKALREFISNTDKSQPAAKKMPRQLAGPPPKKAKAEAKAVSGTKIIIVKNKPTSPASSRAEPSS